MKVYGMYQADEFKSFNVHEGQRIMWPDDEPWKSDPNWEPPEILLCPDEEGYPEILGDYSCLVTLPMFSQKAVDVLGDVLEDSGQLMPLKCREVDTPYFGFRVTKLVDIDEEKSVIYRNSLGNIQWIDKPVFISELLKYIYIFKIRQLPRKTPSVTNRFVQRVQEAGLTGFYFEEIWSDE
jgi:hypothetical protein